MQTGLVEGGGSVGVTWTPRIVGKKLNGVAYGKDLNGNGLFVAVGGGGTILTSPDGITWTLQTSGTSNTLYGIAYGNGRFVAVGENVILTSP